MLTIRKTVCLLGLLTLALCSPVGGRAEPPELQKLHALLVIDTRSGLGESVKVDGDRMDRLLKKNIPRERLDLTILTGKDVTANRIVQYYRNLKAGSTHALLFYYAGHGAIDPSKGHFLALQELNTKPLLRSDLRKSMQEKNAGLVVLLTDCCSERFKLPAKKRAIVQETGEAKELHPVLRCLLFQHRGLVDITAALDSTAAFGDDYDGGLFTRTLAALLQEKVEGLDSNKDKFVGWKELFPRLERETESAFGRWVKEQRTRGQKVEQATQKPRALTLPESAEAPLSVRLVNATSDAIRYQYRWAGAESWEEATLAAQGSRVHVLPMGKQAAGLEVKFPMGETSVLKLGKAYRYSDKNKNRGLVAEPGP